MLLPFIPNTIWLSQGITRPIDIYHTERHHIRRVSESKWCIPCTVKIFLFTEHNFSGFIEHQMNWRFIKDDIIQDAK